MEANWGKMARNKNKAKDLSIRPNKNNRNLNLFYYIIRIGGTGFPTF